MSLALPDFHFLDKVRKVVGPPLRPPCSARYSSTLWSSHLHEEFMSCKWVEDGSWAEVIMAKSAILGRSPAHACLAISSLYTLRVVEGSTAPQAQGLISCMKCSISCSQRARITWLSWTLDSRRKVVGDIRNS